MNMFRKNRSGPVGRQHRVEGQGADVEAVRAFLNCHHPALDARPIDLAVASDEGLAAVEGAIAAESQRTRPSGTGPRP